MNIVVPEGGTEIGARVAKVHHEMVIAWRATGISVASICRRFGLSKQTWSRLVRGERWPGSIGFAALADVIDRVPARKQMTRP